MKKKTYLDLQDLKYIYKSRRESIHSRLAEFASTKPEDYFYELVYCLLTPQSSAVHADAVVIKLREAEFHRKNINPEPFLRRKESYIRFHRTKARHLIQLKNQFPEIAGQLSIPQDAFALRDWLAKNVLGLGMKEASHFLRNIGRNDGLTILDRHILRNLQRFKIISSIPNPLSKNHYLSIEKRFLEFSRKINIPVDDLDLLFWSMETGEVRK
jgi:N-glycosylase/DNA lyase